MLRILKQPAETLTVSVDFSPQLLTLAAIASVAFVAQAGGAQPAVAAQSTSGARALISVAGGVDGETYLMTVRASDAGSQTAEREVEILCQDLTWSSPAIINPYLTTPAYIARFGLEETIRLTDDDGAGRVGKAALEAALGDAQAIIDGWCGGRFAVPLAPVPPLIAAIAGDLARYRLHRLDVPDAVTRAQADATRMLERIADGRMTLATAPAPAASGESPSEVLLEGPPRQFSDASLVDL